GVGRAAGPRRAARVTVIAFGCLAGGLCLWARPTRTRSATRRLVRVTQPGGSGRRDRPRRASVVSRPWAASASVALAVYLLVGGPNGAVAAGAVLVGVRTWLGRLEPREVRALRESRQRELPLAVDLLAACLSAGAAPSAALRATASACESTLAADLSAVARGLGSGATAAEAFAARPEDLAVLAAAFDRSGRTGSAVAPLLETAAEQLRADTRAARLVAARRLAVSTALPLGLCFLPGFVVLGLVPVVIGLVQSLV
ncbi:MAG: type II secretion system F family protein, partial [Actinomycetes bacterium]